MKVLWSGEHFSRYSRALYHGAEKCLVRVVQTASRYEPVQAQYQSPGDKKWNRIDYQPWKMAVLEQAILDLYKGLR